jgi:hypothetical protein
VGSVNDARYMALIYCRYCCCLDILVCLRCDDIWARPIYCCSATPNYCSATPNYCSATPYYFGVRQHLTIWWCSATPYNLSEIPLRNSVKIRVKTHFGILGFWTVISLVHKQTWNKLTKTLAKRGKTWKPLFGQG